MSRKLHRQTSPAQTIEEQIYDELENDRSRDVYELIFLTKRPDETEVERIGSLLQKDGWFSDVIDVPINNDLLFWMMRITKKPSLITQMGKPDLSNIQKRMELYT